MCREAREHWVLPVTLSIPSEAGFLPEPFLLSEALFLSDPLGAEITGVHRMPDLVHGCYDPNCSPVIREQALKR